MGGLKPLCLRAFHQWGGARRQALVPLKFELAFSGALPQLKWQHYPGSSGFCGREKQTGFPEDLNIFHLSEELGSYVWMERVFYPAALVNISFSGVPFLFRQTDDQEGAVSQHLGSLCMPAHRRPGVSAGLSPLCGNLMGRETGVYQLYTVMERKALRPILLP